MQLTNEEGRLLVYDRLKGWKKISKTLKDTDLCTINYTGVFLHLESQKYYETYWSLCATEQQDEEPFEHHRPELTEISQVKKFVKFWKAVWEAVKENMLHCNLEPPNL